MAQPEQTSDKPVRLLKSVVLVGMMGSGKTAIGKALAARLNIPFEDSDAAIETAAQATIAEIFARDGEPFFRKRETEVIARLLAQDPIILATGGGAFLAEPNRQLIDQLGISVWLDAKLGLIWDRVRHKDTRPLLRTADPFATLSQLFEDRTPIYAKASLRVAVDPGWSIEQTTTAVLDVLRATSDTMEQI